MWTVCNYSGSTANGVDINHFVLLVENSTEAYDFITLDSDCSNTCEEGDNVAHLHTAQGQQFVIHSLQ